MRRALVIAGAMLAALLALVPAAAAPTGALAAASPRPPSTGYGIEEMDLKRRIGDAVVYVQARDGEGVTLLVRRGPYTVIYAASEGEMDGKNVSARFGSLGSLNLTFGGPVHHGLRCGHRSETFGPFKGRFEFHGEGGYLDFDLSAMRGELQVLSTCPGVRLRRAPASPPKATATLGARTRGPYPRESFAAVGAESAEGHFFGSVFASRLELSEGMSIQRTTAAKLGRSDFKWNLPRGTATVRPPGPFAGRATFHRHPRGGSPQVAGNLRVPTLGGPELILTGKRFIGTLTKEVPHDE